jgi:hypothetical protein
MHGLTGMDPVPIAKLRIGLDHVREGTIVLAGNAPERVTFLDPVLDDVVVGGGIGPRAPVLDFRRRVGAGSVRTGGVRSACALQALRPSLSVAALLLLRRPL